MTSLVLWVLLFAIFIFFRQEVSKYFRILENRPYWTVFLITAFMSYSSIGLYPEFHSFLKIVIYQIHRIKIAMIGMCSFHIDAYFTAYFFHFLLISALLIGYGKYELKHKGLIYREQVLLVRYFICVILLIFMLLFSYGYDLGLYF